MRVFDVHAGLIKDYSDFTDSLVQVRDGRIAAHLADERERKVRWPDPWISLNPTFAAGGSVDELVRDEVLHPDCGRYFRAKRAEDDPGRRSLALYQHQREAVEAARGRGSYVLTTGTGSGKSLAYIVPIVDAILRAPREDRISAIVVYPMNALANSQLHELTKYLVWGIPAADRRVTFARYTGQESAADRERVFQRRPDILLTNYVMLEYLLTRPHERQVLIGAAHGLRFLVLDELHTYRGRQGADVALLVRRLREACAAPEMKCVGTSATMATAKTFAETQAQVSRVASRLFGVDVEPSAVIGETLRRATEARSPSDTELDKAVAMAAERGQAGGLEAVGGRSYGELASDPLAIWVEDTFGLANSGNDGNDGRLKRRTPTTLPRAAAELAQRTARAEAVCAAAISAMLAEGAAAREPETDRPLFAFRLHQFLTKGDTAYVSLQPPETRRITSQYQVSVPGQRDWPLLPLAFCRECGHEYLEVTRVTDADGVRYLARTGTTVTKENAEPGYLYLASDDDPDALWPDDPLAAGRIPDTWLDPATTTSPKVLPRLVEYLPKTVWAGTDGRETPPGEGTQAWFVAVPFRFCLRCRVSYEQPRIKDFAKLATFAAEGRSSAVSLLSVSVLRGLQAQEDLKESARKLLTFVDNRQDASLQAGHLNDFVQVTRLRGALWKAAAAADEHGLRHDEVAQKVTDALDLPIRSFSRIEDPRFSQKDNVLRALRAAVAYRIYADLERGWRVTMPNLEQTGLLLFDYVDLAEIAAEQDLWAQTHALLRDDSARHRAQLGRILLDEMRRALAVEAEVLTQAGHERLLTSSDQLLKGVWAIPPGEPRVNERTMFASAGAKGGPRDAVHITARGAFGRYLRRAGEFPHAPGKVTIGDADKMIGDLVKVLLRHGLIAEVEGPRGTRGYQVRSSTLIWRAGDGSRGAPDPLRKMVDDDTGMRVNTFFRDLYRRGASDLNGLLAAEHTAQVPAKRRQEREEAFRLGGDPDRGGLPLLYCSPTMELGVDIAELNAVAMRNVPPTPANYAQRSGRAGRSGQPALVTTYCSTGSAHDQYYFRRSHQMVAGSVTPPRLDLKNEDLVRSHVHAIWLAETGASLGRSLTDVLAVEEGPRGALPLPVHLHLAAQLTDPDARLRASAAAASVLTGDEIHAASWWHEGWIGDVIQAASRAFDAACDRWRDMYRAAVEDQREQNLRVLDRSMASPSRDLARRRRYEAEERIKLLTNEAEETPFSDFYSYRYFASEGFLPGYSFPRLPLAAYIPGERGGRTGGDYIQRPRFIAVAEFGPGALIYHEGDRYQVTRVQIPGGLNAAGDIATTEARLCGECGYWHDRGVGTNRCEECDAPLSTPMPGLMHLQTVMTQRRRRISSDEEERRRAGFDLLTTYRFATHGRRPGRLAATIEPAEDGSGALASLVFGDTATVRVINQGLRRRSRKDQLGFWLDPVNGRWITEKKATEPVAEESELADFADDLRARKVVPFVEDRRNIAVIRLASPVDDATATTLRYALERGIETMFQLEDSELTSEALPDSRGQGRFLLIESTEGGAGVLRRLHDEPTALAEVAAKALELIHYDPATGEDLGHAPGARERCERGCYDCLLSYTNQTFHLGIDRHLVVDLLRRFASAETVRTQGHPDGPAGRASELAERAESDLERRLLTFLREGGFRLPDAAQARVDEAFARPDFVYHLSSGPVAVFVDGPHHNAAPVAERDAAAEDRLADLGWLVVRFRYDEEWGQVVHANANVFGTGRAI
ncbi:DEAD/DEAH box helicase domain-containing protein [Frankia sp. AiPs1]|uniref:DEAD/DEAH box helicase n=1 Tax=Frankia sp. AiPa1 TaxID=573492 RepID=UPI00202B42E4|nr:DEAD/DEAH box helicase [Frankia sp. AiPa1]MCL9759145.1 DEAD/DEAH box helicase [Frankia sp. AiPa1]